MAFGFKAGSKRGKHYDLAKFATNKMKSANLAIKGRNEREFEHAIVSHLQSSPKLRGNLITQVDTDEVDKITQASLFGFSHRPDVSIGNDGTAIEIKVITGGQSARDLLGQAIAYRMHYRFVILVFVDLTADLKVVKLCQDEGSHECSLLYGLADTMNVFSVVGPIRQSKNAVFFY